MRGNIAKVVLALGALSSPLEAGLNKYEYEEQEGPIIKRIYKHIENSSIPYLLFSGLMAAGSYIYLIMDGKAYKK